jgi:hypothetical protein
MCEPTTIMTALAVATTAAEYLGASADADSKSADNQTYANSVAEQRDLDVLGLATARGETVANVSEDKSEMAREALVLRGKMAVANSERGGLGNSAGALMRDIDFQSGLQFARLDENHRRGADQYERDIEGVYRSADNNIKSIPEVKRPSALAAGLKIAGSVASNPDVQSLASPTSSRLSIPNNQRVEH